MASARTLSDLLAASARRFPDRTAIEEPPAFAVTYRELDALADRACAAFQAHGVRPGDRVGIYLPKSIDAVAAMFGAMRAGAAYVPVDPDGPVARAAYILTDCAVRVAVVAAGLADGLRAAFEPSRATPTVLTLEGVGGGRGLAAVVDSAAPGTPATPGADDLAYILYTSGSTGRPKGVMLTHRNALGFVDWCSATFAPGERDRFSSHAPFHFDLSILDLYVPLAHGAAVVLIGSSLGKDPVALGQLIAARRLTIWYSTPSILSLLEQYGKLDRQDLSTVRIVLFAGEVFPVKYLRAVKARFPQARFVNLYGPTETNVCNYHDIPALVPEDRTEPYPIGRVCEHLRARVVDEGGADAPPDAEGELCIAGANVMQGYWNLPEQTGRAFLQGAGGERWYRTGDVVVCGPGGVYTFVGRRDRMVKRRGYRIELGEIEAGLYRHPAVREAAVVAARDEESGVRITAFLACRDDQQPSLIALKRFCAEALPAYMIPDAFRLEDALPKTSTDKIDYQRLLERA